MSGFTRTIVEAIDSTSTAHCTRTSHNHQNIGDTVHFASSFAVQTTRQHYGNPTATLAPVSTYMASENHQLSDDDCITALEAEISFLRSQEVPHTPVTHMATQIAKSDQRKVQEPEVRSAVPPVTQYQQENTSTIQILSPQPPLVPENTEYSHFGISHTGYLPPSQKDYGTTAKAKQIPEKQKQATKPVPWKILALLYILTSLWFIQY